MPPKADPYANSRQRAVDVLLIIITALVFFLTIIIQGQDGRRDKDSHQPDPYPDQVATK